MTRRFLEQKAAFVRAYYLAGGKIAAGTDTLNPYVIPGISLHQELERLVSIGLSPMDALVAATGRAAELLGVQQLGIVKPGAIADLVLVAGDPLTDITATQNIQMVVKGGTTIRRP